MKNTPGSSWKMGMLIAVFAKKLINPKMGMLPTDVTPAAG
jgi:hypothetical protein